MRTSMEQGSLLKDLLHSSLSFLFHPHALASWLGRQKQQCQRATRPPPPRSATAAFLKVDADYQDRPGEQLDPDARYWWTSSGLALAVLLERAGYPGDAQHRLLAFVRAVVPSLGAGVPPGGRPRWRSFMTDDHTPVELSWDWRAGAAPPKVRFSIEPVGARAGTPADPHNQHAAARLRAALPRLVPGADAAWLGHFHRHLNGEAARAGSRGPDGPDDRAAEGHLSREFYAFDLDEDGGVLGKAYFFPGFRARATGRSRLDVIRDAIGTAPGCAPERLAALRLFAAYAEDASTPPLEMDMLAIDLAGAAAASRFKIYFRVRDTSFASVRAAMSLGGRVGSPELDRGLAAMRRLYRALLLGGEGPAGGDDGAPLPARDHRTAGILYNVEFRCGSERPRVKAYLPVRHYAPSEDAVVAALGDHFGRAAGSAGGAPPAAGWGARVAGYTDAVRTIFSREAMRTNSGLHTYIGCSVEAGARLRLVSYINPRQSCMSSAAVDED